MKKIILLLSLGFVMTSTFATESEAIEVEETGRVGLNEEVNCVRTNMTHIRTEVEETQVEEGAGASEAIEVDQA